MTSCHGPKKTAWAAAILCGAWATLAVRAEEGTAATNTPPVRLPEVSVAGQPITENTLVGEYKQPEWTTRRRFPATRIYLQEPPGAVGVEQWVRTDWPREGRARSRFRTEAELGLPGRFQLDLYEDTILTRQGTFYHNDVALELRYAFADWGRIPLNPTLYGEYKFANRDLGPDVYEVKLLLGDSIGENWHYGVNLVHEQEVGDARATEFQISQALGYTLSDRKWSIGEEAKIVRVTEKDARGDAEIEVSVGPSVQWRMSESAHLDVVALFGCTDAAPELETYVVFGWALGAQPSDRRGPRAPVSMKGE